MERIGVGLIGYGLAGATFHAPLVASDPRYELRAIVTRSAAATASRTGARVVADPEDLLADPAINLVVVATPNATHAPLAARALDAGKHVVVDKPITVTAAEADELLALAARRGRYLTVFHNRRWDGDFRTVRGLVSGERLGRLHTFESHFNRFRPTVRERWKEQAVPGGGVLHDLGTHLVDQALQLFGMPDTVVADLGQQRPGASAIDYFHLILRYGELRVILHSGSIVRQPWPRFVLHGEGGSFVKYGLDPQEGQLGAGLRPGQPGWGREPEERHGLLTVGDGVPAVRVATEAGAYEQFYSELAKALAGTGPVPVVPTGAADVIRVLEAALASAADGRRITLR